jgi:signal peptidase II
MTGLLASRYAFLVGAGAVALVDQGTKALVVGLMRPGQSLPVLGPAMSLTYAQNTGGAFSLAQGGTAVLAAVSLVVVAALVVYGLRAPLGSRRAAWGLSLVMGGAVGNLIDRAARGFVVDFLDFHFWPVFNMADIAITVGVVLIGWHLLAPPRPADSVRAGPNGRAAT